MGVGAAIAPGSQEWNGACADFVSAPSSTRTSATSTTVPDGGEARRVTTLATGTSVPTQALPEIDWIQLGQMFGFEDLLAHTDGMRSGCHNYFMHLDAAGRWSFLAWSVDLSLLADSAIDSRDLLLLIRMVVEKMPEQRRRIFRMSREEGLSNDQIAEQLSISRRTVENQISRALAELRKLVKLILFFF